MLIPQDLPSVGPARAADYLRETSLRMAERYVEDCVHHAAAVAERLLGEGRAPWIGMIRWIEERGETQFHGPLIPRRFAGRQAPTWNTHFVCCCDGEVWDPLVGEPIALDRYTDEVFGLPLPIAERMATDELIRSVDRKSLRRDIFAR